MMRRFEFGYVMVLATMLGCGGSVEREPPGGDVNPGLQCAPPGATAKAADGCNTCTCAEGVWACTDMACPKRCTPGETKPDADGCNTCACGDSGEWICTQKACPPRVCGGFAGNTCTAQEYCAYEAGQHCGAADASSVCKPRPQNCPDIYAPVCGCNGKTYANGCEAAAAGTGIFHQRPCETPPACKPGETKQDGCNHCVCSADGRSWQCTLIACPPPSGTVCGARAGNTCSSKEYCAYEPEQLCGAADATAVCKPRPDACTTEYDPVCGCNGETYSNRCFAALAGFGIAKVGTCPIR